MSFETQRAKLCLSKAPLNELKFTNKQLWETHQIVNRPIQLEVNLGSENINQNEADEVFKTLFCKYKWFYL